MKVIKKSMWVVLGCLSAFLAVAPCPAAQHSFREVDRNAPKTLLYRYFFGYYFAPLEHFMPKDRKDWTIEYLYAHPKSEAIVWYFMEKEFYKGGMPAARDFLQALYHYGHKKHSVELEFDVYLAQVFFEGDNLPVSFWSIHFPADEVNHCLKVASLSQAYCTMGFREFDGIMGEYRFFAKHNRDSYILEYMGYLCLEDNLNLALRSPRSEENIKFFTESRALSLFKQSVKVDPNNVNAILDVVDQLHEFKPELQYAIEGKKSFLRQHLPEGSRIWRALNNSIAYCKQELGQN